MRITSRLFATAIAVAVWVYAGYSVASGPTAFKAIAPVALDAAVACAWRNLN
jgi:hypothetical protein